MPELTTLHAFRVELREARDDWQRATAGAVEEIRRFADGLGQALGVISRREAVDALERIAHDTLERLR